MVIRKKIWLSVVYIRACVNWLLNLKGALIVLFVYNHQNSTGTGQREGLGGL